MKILFFISFLGFAFCQDYRLPQSIAPEHYDLDILTHFGDSENFAFLGNVLMTLNVEQATNSITVHSKDLEISEKDVNLKCSEDDSNINVVNVEYKKDLDFLIINLEKDLEQGKQYKLKIPFKGRLKDDLIGYYRSSYKDEDGKKEWLAVTQFEADYARRAFPCFDEPAFKSTFKIKLGRSSDVTSISNMPLVKSEPIDGMDNWYWDTFEKSVPMSTYLVAYMVSKFDYMISPKTDSNVQFRIWAKKSAINQTEYASVIGPKVLSYYEQYFNVPYPLPKQDMIAVPDFHSGAMENWGIITYRETALLYHPNVSSTSNKYRVASVIAHELAHQWFGNLVTMKWWTDLWLNEGFATYVATLGVNHVYPEWNVLVEEAVENLIDVFRLDALNNSHPVSVPIGHPNEISQIFDTISYKKGSAIIRMMNLFLGENVFREGVSNYLKKYKYKNAEQDDLWESLTLEAHEQKSLPGDITVKQIMDSWTKQTGYPLIFVNRDYTKNTVEVSQIRYRNIPNLIQKSSTQKWWIPLTYITQNNVLTESSKSIEWLRATESVELTNLTDSLNWILFNVKMSGLYRVNYDAKNWELITDALMRPEHDQIPTLNRVQLLIDAMDFAWTNNLNYDVALRLTQYITGEKEYICWRGALIGLGRINAILKRTSDYGVFKKYMRKIIAPTFHKVGGLNSKVVSTPDKLDAVKHQVLISSWACRVDVPSCKKHALQLYYKWMKDSNPDVNNSIPSDLRSEVYCIGINKGGEAEWTFLWQRYLNTNVASEKATILRSLGCTTEVWLIIRYLEWSITKESGIRSQDSYSVFDRVGSSDVGYYVAKKFLFDRIGDIATYHNSTPSTIGHYVRTIGGQTTTDSEFVELKQWIDEHRDVLKGSSIAIKQVIEYAEIRLQWLRQHHKNVVNVLKDITK